MIHTHKEEVITISINMLMKAAVVGGLDNADIKAIYRPWSDEYWWVNTFWESICTIQKAVEYPGFGAKKVAIAFMSKAVWFRAVSNESISIELSDIQLII